MPYKNIFFFYSANILRNISKMKTEASLQKYLFLGPMPGLLNSNYWEWAALEPAFLKGVSDDFNAFQSLRITTPL